VQSTTPSQLDQTELSTATIVEKTPFESVATPQPAPSSAVAHIAGSSMATAHWMTSYVRSGLRLRPDTVTIWRSSRPVVVPIDSSPLPGSGAVPGLKVRGTATPLTVGAMVPTASTHPAGSVAQS
jgi:hypothetical protein